MSETIDQILARGIAAAKSQMPSDHAESRSCLKWALRSPDATSEQKATAWLWLSQLESDVADKQFCLDQALELDPDNILARRGLSILKKRLASHELSHPHASNGVWRSSCPQCGGTLEFEVAHNQLTCQYCGYHRDPQLTLHHATGEQDFLAALPTRRAQNWHLAVAQTLKCSGCGATFTLPKFQVSGECPFCGSLHVLETTTETDLIEPDGILVFQIDEIEAQHAAEDWLKHHHSPEHKISASRLHAVYLPHWTFDLDGEISFNTHYHPIRDREGILAGGEWVGNVRPVRHDDLLVPATHTIPMDLLDQVGDFSTTALQPYSSEILAAWSAEVYQISLADASLIARQHAVNIAQQNAPFVLRLDASFGFPLPYTARVDSTRLGVQSYKLVLLPVWLGRYRFQDQIYRLVINGQTGNTAGEEPPEGWRHRLSRILGNE